MKFIVTLVVLIVFPLAPSLAVSLEDFVGEWKGKGRYTREGADQRQGKLSCRLKIKAMGSSRIIINGRCGAAIGAKDFDLQITQTTENALSVLDLAKSSMPNRKSAGQLDSAGIKLSGTVDGISYTFDLTLPDEGKMQLDTSEISSATSDTGQVLLERRK